ncbi:M14 family zinc carboxypeptidase [Aquipuribacter sp. SD81]|uniref:M14 family zinc carboxypeptidase n=1 Tax=Aquipuribacter sp. SD81 TaxID=3127703 RepID=UPI00301917E2
MISRRQALLVPLAALPAAAVAGAVPAAAAETVPGGPWVQENQPVVLAGMTDNSQLVAELQRLAARRPDTVRLTEIGRSLEDRPIYRVSVGSGPRTLMVVTQQHGDEPVGTEAALQLLTHVSGPSREASALREQVTLEVVPRVNPDGFERWLDPESYPGEDPRRNAANLDLNREYDPAVPVSADAPEAAAVRALVDQVQPDLVLDYHHQVSYVTDAGEQVTMSVLWATVGGVEPSVVDDGRRAAVVVAEALEDFGHATVTRYPESTTRSVARNGLALAGTPALLIEQRGQYEVGQKSLGAFTREALVAMEAVLESLADGSFDEVDPADADLLPERGDRDRQR